MHIIFLRYLWSCTLVVVLYVLAHGITALVVFPIQHMYFSNIAIYASLVYLPQGVRVLATWIMGWKVVLPLIVAQILSQMLFMPEFALETIKPELMYSAVIGATAALFAFEGVRLLGPNIYARENKDMSWKWILIVGAIASVLNSMGQSYVFSGTMLPSDLVPVFLVFAFGDLIGLVVTMFTLMLVFRWMRLLGDNSST